MRKLNKKGSAIIELIISIFIFAAIVLVVTNFKTYLATQEAKMIQQSTFYSHIDIELANIYSEDNWDNLENKTTKTDTGDLLINIEKKDVSEFNTKVIEVEFKLKELTKTLNLERSVYYDE